MSSESTELLDAFKAAALSVTKLYKTSFAGQIKSRADGYQDCLEDLLGFLDKERLGLGGGEGWKIRTWATRQLDGRDSAPTTIESEDETEKPDAASPPRASSGSSATAQAPVDVRNEIQMRDLVPPAVPTAAATAATMMTAAVTQQQQQRQHQGLDQRQSSPLVEDVDVVVPSQEMFTFQSSVAYPQDAYMGLANLDLSDSQTHNSSTRSASTSSTQRNTRGRIARTGSRVLGRGSGQKRKVNLAEIFDVGSLGYGFGKDVFGGGKRTRHN